MDEFLKPDVAARDTSQSSARNAGSDRLPPSTAPRAAEVDPVEQDRQLRRVDLVARARPFGKVESPLSKSPVPETESSTVPPEDFRPITAPAGEEEQVAAEGVVVKGLLDHSGEPIKGPAHVAGLGGDEDLARRRQPDHGRSSRTATRRLSVSASKPGRTRMAC